MANSKFIPLTQDSQGLAQVQFGATPPNAHTRTHTSRFSYIAQYQNQFVICNYLSNLHLLTLVNLSPVTLLMGYDSTHRM